jgi:hypothetical protein
MVMRRTFDIGWRTTLPSFETITNWLFSTVTRRTVLMSRSSVSPSLVTMMRRCAEAGCAASGEVLSALFAVSLRPVDVVLRFGVRDGLARELRAGRAGRVVLESAGFSSAVEFADAVSASAGVSVLSEVLGEAAGGDARLLVPVEVGDLEFLPALRLDVSLAPPGLSFAGASTGARSVGVAEASSPAVGLSATGSSMRAPVDVTRRTLLSLLSEFPATAGASVAGASEALSGAGANEPPNRIV